MPTCYLVLYQRDQTDNPDHREIVVQSLSRRGRILEMASNLWLMVAFQPLAEILDGVGSALESTDQLFIVPFHEYAAKHLPAPAKMLIDAAWHPEH